MSARKLLGLSVVALLSTACGGAPPPPLPAPEPKPVEPAPVDARYVVLPTPGVASTWAPPAVLQSTLPNGLGVWQLEQAGAPLVSIHVVLPVGSATDPRGKEGLAALTADLLDEGAGKRSALELSDALGVLATDYQATAGLDYVLLSMNALSDNFEASLEILADIVRRPRLDAKEFARRRDQHVAQAIARGSNPNSQLSAAYHRVLFGNGYGGSVPEGTQESLATLRLTDVKAMARSFDAAEGSHVVVVGGLDAARVQTAVKKAFGDWKGKRKATTPVAETVVADHKAYVVPFLGAAQSSLAVLTRAGDAHDPNYFAELVMNRPVGEAFTSRINLNLREDKGYTYGAFSTFRRYLHGGYFGVVANVKSDVTAASVKEILSELDHVCSDRPLTEAERNEAVDGLLLGYPLRFERVDEVGTQVASLAIYGRPADFWQRWPERVKEISTARIEEAARPYCPPSRYQIVIAGDPSVVTPGLAELGYTVVELPRSSASANASANASEGHHP